MDLDYSELTPSVDGSGGFVFDMSVRLYVY